MTDWDVIGLFVWRCLVIVACVVVLATFEGMFGLLP